MWASYKQTTMKISSPRLGPPNVLGLQQRIPHTVEQQKIRGRQQLVEFRETHIVVNLKQKGKPPNSVLTVEPEESEIEESLVGFAPCSESLSILLKS